MDSCLGALRLLLGLLAAAYIGINIVARLPRFLVAENIVYAVFYGLAAVLGWGRLIDATAFIAAFNAGRVSRSVVTPRGEAADSETARLASHAGLTALLVVASLLALACGAG